MLDSIQQISQRKIFNFWQVTEETKDFSDINKSREIRAGDVFVVSCSNEHQQGICIDGFTFNAGDLLMFNREIPQQATITGEDFSLVNYQPDYLNSDLIKWFDNIIAGASEQEGICLTLQDFIRLKQAFVDGLDQIYQLQKHNEQLYQQIANKQWYQQINFLDK